MTARTTKEREEEIRCALADTYASIPGGRVRLAEDTWQIRCDDLLAELDAERARAEAAEAQLAALREAMEAAGVSRGLLHRSPTTMERFAACEAAEAALADTAAAAEAYTRRVRASVLRGVLEHVAAEMHASTVAGGTVPRDLQGVYGWLRAEAERIEGGS